MTVLHSDIRGGYSGTANIDGVSLFVAGDRCIK